MADMSNMQPGQKARERGGKGLEFLPAKAGSLCIFITGHVKGSLAPLSLLSHVSD